MLAASIRQLERSSAPSHAVLSGSIENVSITTTNRSPVPSEKYRARDNSPRQSDASGVVNLLGLEAQAAIQSEVGDDQTARVTRTRALEFDGSLPPRSTGPRQLIMESAQGATGAPS